MSQNHHPPWFDPERPSHEDGVLPFILERNAREAPHSIAFKFENGEIWTNEIVLEKTQSTAAALVKLGVKKGQYVVVWLPTSPEIIRVWFALNYLGAVFVPLNIEYRGNMLTHALSQARPSLMVIHPALLNRLNEIKEITVPKVIVMGDAECQSKLDSEIIESTIQDGEIATEPANVKLWDPQVVIFTSGTTGPSKGVVCPYLQQFRVGQCSYGYMNSEDCIVVDLPMFHVGGISSVIGAISKRARVALYNGFSTGEFWKRIRENNATTVSGIIGAMAAFLYKTPEANGEKDNSLRIVTLMLNEQAIAVAKRFGFSYVSGFNMSELSVPLLTEVDCPVAGSCGVPRTGVEARVVDENDVECKSNVVGELIVRFDQPWESCIGYLNQPEATAKAWRNGWFHTGDLVRSDSDGNFFFVDRLKDAVRRRGENISSLEVESEILGYPEVSEAAVVGVASEHGEEEILAIVAGDVTEPRKLIDYLIPRLPHYMVPRYVRIVGALPKTSTNKIQKYELRDQGITQDTWDREADGIVLKRTVFK